MTEEPDITADEPTLQLLTDALRAGPASPEWAAAAAQLHVTDPDGQRAALLAIREKLESGRGYREVRAGAGFTRKLFARVAADAPAGGKKKSPLGVSFLSYLGACAIVGTASVLAFILINSATGGGEDLSRLFFRTTVMSTKLDGPLGGGWRLFGPLGLDPARGLLPTDPGGKNDFRAGGIVSTTAISAAEPFAVEVTMQFRHVGDDLVPQVFVTDQPRFDGDSAGTPRELVWLVRNGLSQVAPVNGGLVVTNQKIGDGQTVTVRLVIGVNEAQVSCDNRTLWSGAGKLTGQGRYVGVRLLRRGTDKRATVTVTSIRVMER